MLDNEDNRNSNMMNDHLDTIQKAPILNKEDKNPYADPLFISGQFQALLDHEHQKEATRFLSEYFDNNPFFEDYNPELITSLMIFFDPNSQYGIDGVDSASEVLSSFFFFMTNYPKNQNPFIFTLLNNQFYLSIWPYFLKSRYVIKIFEYILYIERPLEKRIQSGKQPETTAYQFLINVNIFNEIKKILTPDFIHLPDIFDFFKNFRFYVEYHKEINDEIKSLISSICELVFSVTEDNKWIDFCYNCLGKFGSHQPDIGFFILNNPNFQESLKNVEILGEGSIRFLKMIDNILNFSKKKGNEPSILSEIRPLNSFLFMNFHRIFMSSIENTRKESIHLQILSLYLISCLNYSKEEIESFIQNNCVKQYFDLISANISYKVKIGCISVLCQFVSCGSKEAVALFIENGFIGIISDMIDDLLNDIPHQILDALDTIDTYSETDDDCAQWLPLIFDDESIIDALEKAAAGEYLVEDDCNDYYESVRGRATNLLQRMNY